MSKISTENVELRILQRAQATSEDYFRHARRLPVPDVLCRRVALLCASPKRDWRPDPGYLANDTNISLAKNPKLFDNRGRAIKPAYLIP